MSNSITVGRRLAVSVVAWQVVVAGVSSALFLWLRGGAAALAALFGGAVVVVPTAWFALAVLVRGAWVPPHKVPGVFYRAEVTKFVFMALGFALGASWFGDRFAALILTSAACLAVQWVMLLTSRNK